MRHWHPTIFRADAVATHPERTRNQRVFHFGRWRDTSSTVSIWHGDATRHGIQMGFLKMCGRPLDKLQRVPIPVLEHLSPQLGGTPPEIATLRAIYGQRRPTLYDHQQFALDIVGMTRFDLTADAPRVMDALCDEVRAGVDGDKLLAQTRPNRLAA